MTWRSATARACCTRYAVFSHFAGGKLWQRRSWEENPNKMSQQCTRTPHTNYQKIDDVETAVFKADLAGARRIAEEWRELSERAERRDAELDAVKTQFSETTRQQVGVVCRSW